MTKAQFAAQFLTRFECGFAEKKSIEIQDQVLQKLLIDVMHDAILFHPKNIKFQTDAYNFLRVKKKTEREQIAFRSAYLFETLYFKDKNIIHLIRDDFVTLLAAVNNESMKRHFGKIVTDILKHNILTFTEEEYELMSQTVTSWAVAPKTRVAVQIWAFEILVLLQKKIQIEEETIGYLLEIFTRDSSPAMKCRVKRWKKRGVFSY
jgi:hypothetical protein